jgi:hypothetical protein
MVARHAEVGPRAIAEGGHFSAKLLVAVQLYDGEDATLAEIAVALLTKRATNSQLLAESRR